MTRVALGRALLALALAATPRPGAGQNLQVTPTVSLSQMHDDNLFATPAAESDDVSRVGAGLAVGRRSARLSLKARYALEGEIFRRHPELNRAAARQDAALGVEWAASPRLGIALSADYVDTQTPSELNALTGLESGRRRGRRLSTMGVLTERLSPASTATLEHRFSRDRIVGGLGSDAHVVTVALERRVGPSDRARLGYTAQRLAFTPGGLEATSSHTLTLGWRRAVTPAAQFEFDAGPRLTGRTFGAEVSVGFRHRLPGGDAGITYVHGQTTVLGQPGPVTVKGVRATLGHRLVGPLRFSAVPGVFQILGRDSETTVYGIGVEIAWRVARDVSLSAAHHFSQQDGILGVTRDPSSGIVHNTFLLALTRRASSE